MNQITRITAFFGLNVMILMLNEYLETREDLSPENFYSLNALEANEISLKTSLTEGILELKKEGLIFPYHLIKLSFGIIII